MICSLFPILECIDWAGEVPRDDECDLIARWMSTF